MDWIETTEMLMDNEDYINEFETTTEYHDWLNSKSHTSYDTIFTAWASREYPELYGND